jgi:hypothetical protein
MSESAFDAFTRRAAAAISRRSSLAALGGAALAAAVTGPSVVSVSKAGKRAKKKCKRQKNQCEDTVRSFCEEVNTMKRDAPKRIVAEGGEEERCLQILLECCEVCNVNVGVNCVLEAL